jgi:broad specificity phosphatase PhoE
VTIYLIRHAQSAFNAVHDPKKPDPMIFDAPITALGETQARNARSEVKELDIKNVIVSPFTRTLQTAKLIFGNRLPFKINAEVREQLCNSCDVGSPPQELAKNYPHLDFDHLDDCWWHEGEKDHRGISVEPEEILLERASRFIDFLKSESIQSTAVVSHGNFIRALTGIKPNNCEVIEFEPIEGIVSQT